MGIMVEARERCPVLADAADAALQQFNSPRSPRMKNPFHTPLGCGGDYGGGEGS